MPATGSEGVSLQQLKELYDHMLENGMPSNRYMPGDSTGTLAGTIIPSFVTGSGQRLYFHINLRRNMDASVSGAEFSNLTLTARGINGYITELSNADELPDGCEVVFNSTFSHETNNVHGYFLFPDGWGNATNNTPVNILIGTGTLRFS